MLATAMLLCALAFADDERPEGPPPGPPPRAQRPHAERPPLPEIDALTQQQAWELTRIHATLPDPNAALLQSALLGFGAGHFYAEQPRLGLIHAGVQAVGVGLAGLGGGLASGVSRYSNLGERYQAIMYAGLALTGAGRLADLYTAPYSARKTADETLTFSR